MGAAVVSGASAPRIQERSDDELRSVEPRSADSFAEALLIARNPPEGFAGAVESYEADRFETHARTDVRVLDRLFLASETSAAVTPNAYRGEGSS